MVKIATSLTALLAAVGYAPKVSFYFPISYQEKEIDCSSFWQSDGLYNENEVEHLKVTGSYYDPVLLKNLNRNDVVYRSNDYPDYSSWVRWHGTNLSNLYIETWVNNPWSYWSYGDPKDINQVTYKWFATNFYVGSDGNLYYHLKIEYYANGILTSTTERTEYSFFRGQSVSSLPDAAETEKYIRARIAISIPGMDPVSRSASISSALSNIPAVDSNNIENLCQVIRILTSIRDGSFISKNLPNLKSKSDTASDLWLKYRYSYSTTKMDIDSSLRYLERTRHRKRFLKARGSYTTGNSNYRCTLLVDTSSKDTISLVKKFFYERGLLPSWSKVWDLVPFSFVVDWFTDFNDLSRQLDQFRSFDEIYTLMCIVTSVKSNFIISDGPLYLDVSYYKRQVCGPGGLEGYFYYNKYDVTPRVVLKRTIDALALARRK